MKYRVINARELTADLETRWAAIQQADSSLDSPYFRPEFAQTVAAVRNDVFVGLIEHGNEAVGFFPFHRRRGGIGRPIGLGLSDYHGVIAVPGVDWSAESLLRGCKLVRFEFDHLLAGQHQFAQHHAVLSDSPIIDVFQGMEAYEASHDSSGRKQIREVRRKRQKLSEEIGPVTFTLHSPDPDILSQLLTWKSEQCQRTGTVDFFALEWCVRLVERIHSIQEPCFGGVLASLHAGDTLAAVHFAMYSGNVWHSWFPAYNRELEPYSPGSVLLLEMIQAASERDVKYIDLGKGMSLYKKRVMTRTIPVASGRVLMPSLSNGLLAAREALERWGKRSMLKPLLRVPGRMIKSRERSRRYG